MRSPQHDDDVRRLAPLIAQEVAMIGDLADKVSALRRELVAARPDAELPPAQPPPEPPPTGDRAGDPDAVSAAFDRLQEYADALWFEQQWLTAEIAVARGEFGRYGPTTPAR